LTFERPLPSRSRFPAWWGLWAVLVGFPSALSTAQDTPTHKRVLILHSFGRDFATYAEVSSSFQTELARLSPQPVEFFEASLETARFAWATNEGPLVTYLHSLFSERPIDLLVSVGGPAAQFCLRQRETLFPSTPLILAGVDRRWVDDASKQDHAVAVPVALNLPGVIENILHVLPDTENIVVVLGGSPLGKLWREETEREYSRFSNRVRFTWTNEWSLEEMERRLAALPPRTAIFFGELSVDAAGVPYPRHTALARLHTIANAPMFGLFETQLGRGIVGGPLVSEAESGRRAASTAVRVLNGEAPESIDTPPVALSYRPTIRVTTIAFATACAVSDKVLEIVEREDLVARVKTMGALLAQRLSRLADHPNVGQVRGLGLMQAVEVVRDRDTLERFPAEERITRRIVAAGLGRGVFFYPAGSGPAQDVIMLGPPFIITETDIDLLVNVLEESIDAAVSRRSGASPDK